MGLTREEKERVKVSIGECITGEPITDEGLANYERIMPTAFHLFARKARRFEGTSLTDDFLRSLGDDLLVALLCRLQAFIERADLRDTDSWDAEITAVVARLYLDEKGGNDATDEEMAEAAICLANLVLIEDKRREGCFAWVDRYSLLSGREGPRKIEAKGSADRSLTNI